MEKLKDKGKVKEVGVSNFTIHHLQDLHKDKAYPAFNQVEFHPYLYQKELLSFCRQHEITLIAYRPFGQSKLIKEKSFAKIAEKYKKTSPQIILRWLLEKQIPTIPKSSSEAHLRDNLDIYDFSLSASDLKALDNLNQNKRFCGEDESELDY